MESIALGIDAMAETLKNGGRIFYVGAGTSGRLGVLDASECPPTYGVTRDTVIGIIAGGRDAAFESIEDAEDDPDSCVKQMKEMDFGKKDICVGLSASGSANCVKGALKYASVAFRAHRFGFVQPQFPAYSSFRYCNYGRCRTGSHKRIYEDESGNRTENDTQHAFNRRNGTLRQNTRQLYGIYDPVKR